MNIILFDYAKKKPLGIMKGVPDSAVAAGNFLVFPNNGEDRLYRIATVAVNTESNPPCMVFVDQHPIQTREDFNPPTSIAYTIVSHLESEGL